MVPLGRRRRATLLYVETRPRKGGDREGEKVEHAKLRPHATDSDSVNNFPFSIPPLHTSPASSATSSTVSSPRDSPITSPSPSPRSHSGLSSPRAIPGENPDVLVPPSARLAPPRPGKLVTLFRKLKGKTKPPDMQRVSSDGQLIKKPLGDQDERGFRPVSSCFAPADVCAASHQWLEPARSFDEVGFAQPPHQRTIRAGQRAIPSAEEH
jgi:hypothetical protein